MRRECRQGGRACGGAGSPGPVEPAHMSTVNDAPVSPVTFTFDGDDLAVVAPPGGGHWLVLAQLCAPFGLGADEQVKKLKRLAWAQTVKITVWENNLRREVFCIHLRSVAGWLFTLNAGKVAPHLREKLVRYQRECADALADHFIGPRGAGLSARDAAEQIAQLRREKAVLEAKVELHTESGPGVIGKARAQTWLLEPLRKAARLTCTATDDHSDAAYRRALKDGENQLRLHVGYPASTAQRWENLPLDKLGPAIDKVLEIEGRAERDAQRAKKGKPGNDGGQGSLFGSAA